MHRQDFLKTAALLGSSAFFASPGLLVINRSSTGLSKDFPWFLGAAQAGDRIILFSGQPEQDDLLVEEPTWSFYPDFRPTDAKRMDDGDRISVLIATHGAIYEVPYNYEDKIRLADTYSSCHSVEKLPDGNLISASSNDHQLTVHFNPRPEGPEKIRLTGSRDYRFETAHGVVYDKTRQCVWALGQVLGKFEYVSGTSPHLKLLDTWPLPLCHTDGHDLFPHYNGNLLITTHEGVLELPMGNFAYPVEKYPEKNVKSAVSDPAGRLYVTDPADIDGYENWQTDTIVEVYTGLRYTLPGSKFYKVRLWQKNSFSY